MGIWNRFCGLFDQVHPVIHDDFLPIGGDDFISSPVTSLSSADSLFEDFLLDDTFSSGSSFETEINPANGLPMIGGIGGVDIDGNLYGTTDDDATSFTGMDMLSSDSTSSDSFFNFGSDSFSSDW